MRIWTIGHSTRTLDELVSLLREHDIERLADIRRYPGSRRYPHFSRESLAENLPIAYVHMPELGGRRRPRPDSPNTAWRNEQFRGYADYMATPEFKSAIDALLASDHRTAIMCAEAVPWRCHRNLVADALTRRGHEVIHILGPGASQKHVINPMARVVDDHLEYRT
ncbi:MAG TPA: DUF488 domain-containing protein [Thermoanaerobaculia bacterium]